MPRAIISSRRTSFIHLTGSFLATTDLHARPASLIEKTFAAVAIAFAVLTAYACDRRLEDPGHYPSALVVHDRAA